MTKQELKDKCNFRVIPDMQKGQDNCFICRWNNENEVDPTLKHKICGLHNFTPQGAKNGGKDKDCICDDFEKSKYFKGV